MGDAYTRNQYQAIFIISQFAERADASTVSALAGRIFREVLIPQVKSCDATIREAAACLAGGIVSLLGDECAGFAEEFAEAAVNSTVGGSTEGEEGGEIQWP